MTSSMMGDDERTRKELADRYAEAKRMAEEMKDAKLSDIKIPDDLVDDVIGMMAGTTDKGIRVVFVEGPFDGMVEWVRQVPELWPMRVDAPQLNIGGSHVAVSVFFPVAVYRLQHRHDGTPFYRFDCRGYGNSMEGLKRVD